MLALPRSLVHPGHRSMSHSKKGKLCNISGNLSADIVTSLAAIKNDKEIMEISEKLLEYQISQRNATKCYKRTFVYHL